MPGNTTKTLVRRPPGPIGHPLADGGAPEWAAEWGDDQFGPFAVWQVRDRDGKRLSQQFRWIPPGSFWMGSPENEPGRWVDEGPRHWVTLTRGFWMADTPCNQELWQAVTGKNPSYFPSPRHPVETVSWLRVQEFLTRVNANAEGDRFDLPTEAQWEYACRADSDKALYPTAKGDGTIEILGERNAPALDPIAWYAGNSAVPEGIENGYEVSGWKQRQFNHQRASTQPVGLKLPNAWGLYDMLGNVWEWCLDRWGGYPAGSVVDPERCGEREGDGVSRVSRGGCWHYRARRVRCASRYHNRADFQGNYLGFRLVRVQAS
jgi:sulfatase modifying factor 1